MKRVTVPGDTIVAIATAAGRSGVGIVRLSGPHVPAIAEAIVRRVPKPRVASVTAFRDAGGHTIDQGISLFFAAPHSFTGEHVLELHAHGGPAVLALIMERCVECGARIAAPGEFTQRAFLNGKLDLAQAEAVADLIAAGSASAARAATRSLSGEFSSALHAIAADVLELRTLTEASLDFPEEDIDFVRAADAQGRLSRIAKGLAAVTARARRGSLLREGATLVLVGAPNVGKSSLMNRLAREDVAIVTDLAGTTRDTLRSHIDIGGVPITVVDTAGLRPAVDLIESIGIDRTWSAVAQASILLLVRDAREDHPIAQEEEIVARAGADVPRITVHNKIDLCGAPARRARDPQRGEQTRWQVWVSAKSGEGVDLIERTILELIGADEGIEGAFIARARHLDALQEAAAHVQGAKAELSRDVPALELMAEELRAAHGALGAIVGESTADELLGAIFSKFCIGK
ncbi:MAG: tRNA uridine-5-carboxymethylaminomethyl(34) synthesis GTPase MnmE [Pseudomonadota bacterium]|nr:tRNA uridine-5-carboxymethylaminomethyl(34) synthesis GTPase MnmE [Pseudomonadota bacterium]